MASLVLADALVPARSNTLLKNAGLVIAGSFLLALSARVQFHVGLIPMTGQTFMVCLLAAVLGTKRGLACMLAYLTEGAMGLPVFCNAGAGLAYMAGPTSGYLLGFIAATWLIGTLAERGFDRNVGTTFLMMLAGEALILGPGMVSLSAFLGMHASNVITIGLLPGAILKALLATALLPSAWKLCRRSN
ncbi:TPA: biotin transporter BioY [Candidatus Sumerlaeota bacterium]|jgi:biotin transport system substrate-specific component|nr:biotin transporter BioY [Candidatus Sumerlaeota bacterium]